jgi:pimeloyl-ACP methyl ester carboxylesterase
MGLHFERGGQGPSLLLVHGLGASLAVWRPVRRRLEARRDLLVVDLPGFGKSDPLEDSTRPTAANLAAALAAFCDEQGVERPHVGGNSLGAWVGLELAKRGDARSVCGISPAGLWRNPLNSSRVGRQTVGRRVRPLVGVLTRSARGRSLLLRRFIAHPEKLTAEEARTLAFAYLDSAGYTAANDEMRAEAFDHEGRIEVPVTIAWGEADGILGRPSSSRIPPGARYLTVPGWGHTPMWDDPEGVAGLLLEASSEP